MRYFFVFTLSWLALLWERAWNRFWAVCAAALVFLAAALLNLPALLGPTGHLILLAVFAAALAAAFRLGRGPFAFPSLGEVERRMETANALEHRPLETLHDKPAEGLSAESLGLWQKHLKKAAEYLGRIRVYAPQSDVARQDRFALRHAAAILLALGLVAAQHDAPERLRLAFQPGLGGFAAEKPPALDLWITPPEYTHEAAVFLATAGQGIVTREEGIRVPEGSILKLRLAGARAAPRFRYAGRPYPLTEAAPGSFTLELPLSQSGKLRLSSLFSLIVEWPVTAVPDAAPAVGIVKAEATPRAATKISFEAHDDYGITRITGVIALAESPGQGPYRFDIPPSEKGFHTEDLAAHPWAGMPVSVTLEAEDEAGHKTASAAAAFTLPERVFSNPVAKRLIENRKKLLREKNEAARAAVAQNLAEIADQPGLYSEDQLVFLALSMSAHRLVYDSSDAASDSVQSLLWDLALRLEDGGLSLAQNELRNSLQKMSDALGDKDLPQERLQEIISDVQKKIQQYVRTLAAELQQRREEGKKLPLLSPELAQKFTKSVDLRKMLEQMKHLAQTNSREELQKMAEGLKDAIDNIDMGKLNQMQERQLQAMEALQGMEDVIRRQQSLFDRTNKGGDASPPEEAKERAQEQAALRGKLGALAGNLGEMLETIPDSFAKASRAMKGSEGELGKGRSRASLPHQKTALEELQKGLDNAVEQMAEEMRESMLSFGLPREGGGAGRDPLGREFDNGDSVTIPDEREQRRVQEIIEELRRRSNEPDRSRAERDYIDRLLNQF